MMKKRGKKQIKKEVKDRVLWWLNDMAFKPPELLTEHYYNSMAEDIAQVAVGDFSSTRLDP